MPNPLARAISSLDSEASIQVLLEAGHKLSSVKEVEMAWSSASAIQSTELSVITLLARYHALPPGYTPSALQLLLYLKGNEEVDLNELFSEKNLTLTEWQAMGQLLPSFYSSFYQAFDHMPLVGGFNGNNLIELNQDMAVISTAFTAPPNRLVSECAMGALLVINSSTEFEAEIDAHSQGDYDQLLPFFVWVAKNDLRNLYRLPAFQRLLDKFPESAYASLKIATAFGYVSYMAVVFPRVEITKPRASTLMSIACLVGEKWVMAWVKERISGRDCPLFELRDQHWDPLFWSIRCKQLQSAAWLLENGFRLSDHHLLIAIRMSSEAAVRLLLAYGADVNFRDPSSHATPLHEATKYEKYEIARILVRDYHADPTATDRSGKSPLSYVQDETIRQSILNARQQTPSRMSTYRGRLFSVVYLERFLESDRVDLQARLANK